MSNWLDVAAITDFPPGSRKVVEVDGIAVVLFNLDGRICAVKDECPHDGGILSEGKLEGDVLVCPRHGARFSVCTGAVLGPPAYEDLRTYEIRTVDDRLQIHAPD